MLGWSTQPSSGRRNRPVADVTTPGGRGSSLQRAKKLLASPLLAAGLDPLPTRRWGAQSLKKIPSGDAGWLWLTASQRLGKGEGVGCPLPSARRKPVVGGAGDGAAAGLRGRRRGSGAEAGFGGRPPEPLGDGAVAGWEGKWGMCEKTGN